MPIFDVTVKGAALETKGFTEGNQIDGLGLMTFGLIWGCDNIWTQYSTSMIVNGWSLYVGFTVATSWTMCAGVSITTSWSLYTSQGIENC